MRWFNCLVIGILCASVPVWANKTPRLDGDTQEFITRLAEHPELMDLSFLQYFVGRPENERSQRALSTKHYIWYLPSRQVRCELLQSEQAPSQVVESTFVMPLYDSELRFKDLEKVYGKNAKNFFDYDGQANRLYSFSPKTNVVFTSPRNSFRIQQVRISYRGPALPKPSLADLSVGREHLLKRVEELTRQGCWDEIEPPLMVQVQEHPEDGDAHYWLGRAYAKKGQLHEAITEFEAALSTTRLANGSGPLSNVSVEDLKWRCMAALKELKVCPDSENAQATDKAGQVQITQNGQRMRRVSDRKGKKGQDSSQGKTSHTSDKKVQDQ